MKNWKYDHFAAKHHLLFLFHNIVVVQFCLNLQTSLLLLQQQKFPNVLLAAAAIIKNIARQGLFVDDLISSGSSIDQAIKIRQDVMLFSLRN